MEAHVRRGQRLLALILILVTFVSFMPSPMATSAQEAEPAPAPETVAEPDSAVVASDQTGIVGAEIYEPETEPVVVEEPAEEREPAVEEALPEAELLAEYQSGPISLTLSVLPSVRAGGFVTYTYSYQNMSAATVSDIILDAIWLEFNSTSTTALQHCPRNPVMPGCGLVVGSIQGPEVSPIATLPNPNPGYRYGIAPMAPGETGQFSVRLSIATSAYPQTGKAPRRPTGSARLYIGGETTPSVVDNANSLVMGPVLSLTKQFAPTSLRIYPLQTGTFTVTVGNATDPSDQSGGQPREDADLATNVIVKDKLPVGSEFVSASGNHTFDGEFVIWTLPQLAPGQAVALSVTFRKIDDDGDCAGLTNSTYNGTSNEYPMGSGGRVTISGSNTSRIPLNLPMKIKSVNYNPSNVRYGDSTLMTVVVQNFWPQPVNNIELRYIIQSNGQYEPATALPTPETTPPPGYGGLLVWRFSMPAGSVTNPAEKQFSLNLRMGFTNEVVAGTGRLVLLPDASTGVPSACINPTTGGVLGTRAVATARERVSLTFTSPDPGKVSNTTWYVRRGATFPYSITLKNESNSDLVLDWVRAEFPRGPGGDFRYVAGSSRINGTPEAPDEMVEGAEGYALWNSVPVPAMGETVISYSLTVDGLDLVDYCAEATAQLGAETIKYNNFTVCVKINPRITVLKTVDKTQASPGEIVEFTVTLINEDTTTYFVGIYDIMRDWAGYFVEQVSGYAQPIIHPNGEVEWPRVNLAPGQQIQVRFRAEMPGEGDPTCQTRDVVNEAGYRNPDNNIVIFIPPVVTKTKRVCRQVNYIINAERGTASLRNPIYYTVEFKNIDTTTPSEPLNALVVLPDRFEFIRMDPFGLMITPTVTLGPDNRQRLTWTVPPIAANSTSKLRFYAYASDTAGSHEAWLRATASPETIMRCTGICLSRTYDNETFEFSVRSVTISAMITIEPSVSPTTCAQPGSNYVYRMTILNTNTIDYPDVQVQAHLPIGLDYVSPIGRRIPIVLPQSDGSTILRWENVMVAKKPDDVFATQVVIEFNVRVGGTWSDLATIVNASSAWGLVPRKDGIVQPTILPCPQSPALSKVVSNRVASVGSMLQYQIVVANPNANPITVSLRDVLPANVSFQGMVAGPTPQQSGNTLNWVDQIVPPGTSPTNPGRLVIVLRVRVESGAPLSSHPNVASIVASSVPINTQYNTATFVVPVTTFLPSLSRR